MAREKMRLENSPLDPAGTQIQKIYYSVTSAEQRQLPPTENDSGKVAVILHPYITGGMERMLLRNASGKYGKQNVVVIKLRIDFPNNGDDGLPYVFLSDLDPTQMSDVKVAITAFPEHFDLNRAHRTVLSLVMYLGQGSITDSRILRILRPSESIGQRR